MDSFEFINIEDAKDDSNQVKQNIFFQEGDYSAAIEGIDVCEVNGLRNEQQDTLFVAKLSHHISAPLNFLRKHITAIAKKHKSCSAGTTICSAIIYPATAEQIHEGKIFPKLTIASLGDSPAAIIFRLRNGENVQHISVALTEDHSLEVERVRNQVEANGGRIASDAFGDLRVLDCNDVPALNMGAAVGDCYLRSNKKLGSPLKIEPDALPYDINKLISFLGLPEEKIEAADLILSCDGLYDLNPLNNYASLAVDYKVRISMVEDKFKSTFQRKETKDCELHLSQFAQDFYDQSEQGNFAEELVRSALKFNSKDNISVIRISLMNITEDLIAGIFDGHGVGVPPLEFNPDAPNFADGKLVSASVASDLFLAVKAIEIPELNAQTPQGIFHQMLREKSNAPEKLTISAAIAPQVPTNFIETPAGLDSVSDLGNFLPESSPRNPECEKLQNLEVKDLMSGMF